MKTINPNTKTVFRPIHERMLNAIVAFALSASNIAITSSVAAWLALIKQLQTNLQSIATLRAAVASSIKGYAAQKKAAKSALVSMSTSLMKSIYSYAMDNSLDVLASQMYTSKSALSSKTHLELVQFVQGIINIASPLATAGELTDYGITPASITAWQSLCTQLNTLNSTPKNAIANREALNKDIQNLLRQCMVTLSNQCDQLIYQFEANNLTYFNNYWANRKLDSHSVSTQLRATCQDELNQPVKATVIIDGTELTGYTDETGYALISGIPFGSHSVTVITGDNSKTFGPFDFKKGQSLTQHFTVAPAFAPAAKSAASKSKALVK